MKKVGGVRRLILLLALSSLVVFPILVGACYQTQIIEDISAQEAFALIQENKGNPNFVIIDVRTPEEFADEHIENAVNIDFRSENFRGEINQLDKDKTYLIYCRSGNRSRGALDIMSELSFREVYHLSPGIIGWLEEELPTIKENQEEVLNGRSH